MQGGRKHYKELRLTGVFPHLSNQRAPHGFQLNQKLEAVDRRNPMLIRVATITDTDDYRLKVLATCLSTCVYLCDVIQ